MNLPATVFFSRSLREGTRQIRTYVIRSVLLLAIFGTLVEAQSVMLSYSAPGKTLFNGIVGLNLFLIALAAPGYFASVITEEKEAGTLGLLKMAGLNPVSILLGKSTSQALGAVLLLLVQVPFSVLAVTLGGVSLAQVFACYLTMLAFLLFMANMALFCSVVCVRSTRASTLCVLFLLAFFAGPWIGRGILGWATATWPKAGSWWLLQWAGGLFDLVKDASPYRRADAVMLTGFTGPLVSYQVWSNLALSAAFFLLAWLAFNRFTLEQVTEAPARGLLVRRVRFLSALGPGRAWSNALAWKDFHFLSGGRPALIGRTLVMGLVPAVAFLVAHFSRSRMNSEDLGGVIVTVVLVAAFLEMLVMSARLFGEERKWQTLAAVMTLPIAPGGVALRKALGYALGLLPYAAWFIAGAILMGDAFGRAVGDVVSDAWSWFFLAYVLLLFHIVAYISLILRRGAILLGFAIWMVGGQIVITPLSMMFVLRGSAPVYIMLGMLGLVLAGIVIVQRRIARRLTRAAELE
jgi:hypothetical protein